MRQSDLILKYKMYANATETANPTMESMSDNIGNSMKADAIITQ